MNKSELVKNILEDLQSVNENLLDLSDSIWRDIDHNDNDKLKEKMQYNDLMKRFAELSSEVVIALKPLVKEEKNTSRVETSNIAEPEKEKRLRAIAALDRKQPHGLAEDFTYKRPCAFQYRGEWFLDTNTWKEVFISFLRHIYNQDSEKAEIASSVENIGTLFYETDMTLRSPGKIADGVWVETNHSARALTEIIAKMLDGLAIPRDEMKIYLREDRNA